MKRTICQSTLDLGCYRMTSCNGSCERRTGFWFHSLELFHLFEKLSTKIPYDDHDLRFQRLRRYGDSSDHSATTNWDDYRLNIWDLKFREVDFSRVDSFYLLQDLQPNRALSSKDVDRVVSVYVLHAFVDCLPERVVFGLF